MLRWIGLALGAVLPFAAVAALLALLWLRLVRPGVRPARARPPQARGARADGAAGTSPDGVTRKDAGARGERRLGD